MGERRDRHYRHSRLRSRSGTIARRYGTDEVLPRLFKRERPGGRLLLLDEEAHTGQPIMLTEFGGIAYSPNPDQTWGYSRSDSAESFADQVMELVSVVRSLERAGRILLHAVHRYLSGSQRPPIRGSHSEIPDSTISLWRSRGLGQHAMCRSSGHGANA